MNNVSNPEARSIRRCYITTGISSLNYYNRNVKGNERSNSLLYSLMSPENINNIAKVEKYHIIIDLSDKHIKDIVFGLFNYILPFSPEICVKLIKKVCFENDDIQKCVELLERLNKYNVIDLKVDLPAPTGVEIKKVAFIDRIKSII